MGASKGQIREYVTIIQYLEAMMLGGKRLMGKGSVIESNVQRNIPPNSKIIHKAMI